MIPEEIWKVALARAEALPEQFGIAIRGKVVTKRELIEHIRRRDEIGEAWAKMVMEYLQSLKQL